MTLCSNCFFNSANDFFEAGWGDDGKRMEVCAKGKQPYPFARSCSEYEPAAKVDGDGIE